MLPLPRPDVILTHESDLDGLLSGMLCRRLVRHLFGIEVPLQAFHNHTWRQRLPTERAAWVCDLAFEPRLDRPEWLIIDHHPAAAAPTHARLIHDPAKSTAVLCYDLLERAGLGHDTLRRLVHLSNIADLFLPEDPEFTLAMDYASLVKCYGFWNLHTLLEGEPDRLLDHPLLAVMRVKREIEDPLGIAWSRHHVTRVTDQVGLVETVVGNTNLVIHHLLDQNATPYPVLITLFRRSNGTYLASVRSRNGEAGRVAGRLQGGGHPNAAGAPLPKSVQSPADAVLYLRQVLEPSVPPNPGAQSDQTEGLFDAVKF